ncbi:MAG: EamA family transporter [Crocinitomicaceae bacterium]|nr:EamA family transporter [Crocinitomicaceae bacterium]|tara:strand:- start:37317 stop:38123 length:807 start_codon:yes stop_codon:yes gene_type:complete
MLISVTGFAFMQLCVKFLKHLPTTELVLFRSLVSVVLSGAMIWREGIPPFGNNKLVLFFRGFFGTIALTLYFYTLQNLPISTAAILQYLSPIFTALFAIWLLKEPMKPIRWVYFLISIIGVLLVKKFNPDLSYLYLGAGLLSAVFAGLAYNCIRILRKTDKPVVIVLYFPLVAIPIMLVLSYSNWVWPMGIDWLTIILMGIFTQIGQLFMTKALHIEKANVVTPLKYTGIFYALAFDFFIFGVRYEWMTFAGIAMVLAGVTLNVLRKG